ncbi:LysR family transcriptional regulator [Streptomyces sp. C36]|uniref:LysR family transcriptional regulator n=1 Tax=Streptomyces sp. C36 TaxID=3237122 RepID=UPI0034C6CF19
MLDVPHLRVLLAVAQHRSISAAAHALSYSQSAVSRRITALEHDVGTPLLLRGSRGVRPTPAGEALIEHARVIMRQLALAEERVRALAGTAGGRLRLGAFASANAGIVPELFSRFSRRYPAVRLSLCAGGPADHLAALRAGELDLALVTEWDLAGERFDGLSLLRLMTDEQLVALPAGHRLAGPGPIGLSELREETWIEGAHPDCLGPLRELCLGLGFEPRVGLCCDDWYGKQRMVAAGMGIGLFPALAVPSLGPGLALRSLDGQFPPRDVYLVLPDRDSRAPATGPLTAVLLELVTGLEDR